MAVEAFDPDTACSLLSNTRRRHLLACFQDSAVRPVAELAVEIAAREQEVPVSAVDEAIRERVHISLVHNHIPRLVDHGVLEWDPRSGDVVRDDGFTALESFAGGFDTDGLAVVDATLS